MIGKTNAISGVSAPVPKIRTVSGSVISIFNALAMPAVSLAVDIDPVQDLHGYDNPWPAGGGANKWDEVWERGSIDNSTGEDKPASTGIRSQNYIPVVAGESYYICNLDADNSIRYYYYDANYGFVSSAGVNNSVLTIPSGVSYMRIRSTGTYGNVYKNDWAVNYPATVTTYSPYANICLISGWSNVNVYREAQYDAGATPYATINLNGTVYGGSLDVTTGVLTVTHHFATYDGSENWSSGTNYYVLFSQPNSTGNNDLTQIANWLKAGGSSNYTTYGYYRAQANGAICVGVIGSPWSSVSDFKTALTTNPLTICYELATPQTVQLSPTTVQMLLGNNTIWSDSGDTELQYWARR